MSDPFAPKSVLVYLDRNASSACRLCLLRNRPSTMMVWLKVLPSELLTPYCPACYEELRTAALNAPPSVLGPRIEQVLGVKPASQGDYWVVLEEQKHGRELTRDQSSV